MLFICAVRSIFILRRHILQYEGGNNMDGFNPNDRNVKKIQQFLQTPEGKKLSGSLSAIDKQKIMKTFMSLDKKTVNDKLAGVDFDKIDSRAIEEFLKKFK